MDVFKIPGITAVTSIPNEKNSEAAVCVKDIKAALEAA